MISRVIEYLLQADRVDNPRQLPVRVLIRPDVLIAIGDGLQLTIRIELENGSVDHSANEPVPNQPKLRVIVG